MLAVQLKLSKKKPSDYLAKFAPMPPSTFEVAGTLPDIYASLFGWQRFMYPAG